MQPIMPLFVAHLVGEVPWRATATGAAVAMTGLAGMLGAPFLGRRSDSIGYRPRAADLADRCGLLHDAASLRRESGGLLGLRFGVGIFLGGILPSANALIGRHGAEPEDRGQIYGMTSLAQFLGRFIGPLLGRAVAAHFGFSAVFILIGGLMLTNLAWVATAVRGREPTLEGRRPSGT